VLWCLNRPEQRTSAHPIRRTRSVSCARAASGHATVAPPSSVMNSRRLKEAAAMLETILIILLILALIGALPAWPHSRGWGYAPGGGIGLILLIIIVLVLTGHHI
jgi:Protein of unknown function (DUF3309)